MAIDTAPTKAEKAQQTSRPRALVTGASSGIGAEFGRQLAQRGYDLVVVARRRDRLEQLASEIGGNVEVIEADLSSQAGVEAISGRLGQGDIAMLVNNAGFATNGEFTALPVERELEEIDLNVRALTQLCHAALGSMKEKRSGTIINVASTGAYQPVPYMATYAATKAYVLFLSEALHEEAKAYGVTVTCLCPGLTRTEFHDVANVNTNTALLRRGWSTPEKVVKAALRAAKAGSAIAVPGGMNKMTANMGRVLPRFMVRKVAGSMFKNQNDS
jgi:hypothetical protein